MTTVKIRAAVEKLPANQQKEAMSTLLTLWDNYKEQPIAHEDVNGDQKKFSSNAAQMYLFVHEAVRQPAARRSLPRRVGSAALHPLADRCSFGECPRSLVLRCRPYARSGFTGDSSGVGSSGLPPIKPMSVNDQDTLRTAIADKRSEMEKRYAELGIVPTDDPNGDFAVTPDWNEKITPNLPEDRLFDHAMNKSRGDIDAALEIVDNAHEEEYYHTIDQLQMKRDWDQFGGAKPANADFTDYVKFKKTSSHRK